MKWAFKVLLFCTICFILWSDNRVYPSRGSDPSVKGPAINTLAGPTEIYRYWLRRRDLINRGKTIIGSKELEEIHRVQLDKGIRNLPIFATLLIEKALRPRQWGPSNRP